PRSMCCSPAPRRGRCMAEHSEEPGFDAGEEAAAAPVSQAAVAIALGRTSRKGGKTVDQDASDFLRLQSKLIALQTEHLHEQRELVLTRLRLGGWKDRVTLVLQAMTALIGLAIAAAVAAMAWSAHQDHGLAIAPFSVPPDLAQRGLTGQVVAARVLDRLSALQSETISARPASTYANDWGDDIKVEIPETGVSIGELNRYLRQWLGAETRVSGEVVRTSSGLQITARAGAEPVRSIQGPEADLDALAALAAEGLFASTQPYRYAVYLQSHGRPDEALALYTRLARSGSQEDRRWAYSGWSEVLLERGDNRGAEAVVREGMGRGLSLFETGAMANMNTAEDNLEHAQGVVDAVRLSLLAVKRTGKGNAFISARDATRLLEGAVLADLGDYREAVVRWKALNAISAEGGRVGVVPRTLMALAMLRDHDVTGGLDLLGPMPTADLAADAPGGMRMQREVAIQTQDWPRLVTLAQGQQASVQAAGPLRRDYLEREVWPSLALGYAETGRLADARALIMRTPPDCDMCLDVRARIAARAADWTAMDRWFAALDKQAPEIPNWDTDWARMLLDKGDADAAIARLSLAHEKGPRFADPLELWGEALIAKRDFTHAIAKFAEANKDAPKWGRNHMRWGEALMLSGRYAEARAQYETANGLDLSKPDRAALNVLLARTASGPLHG
ncbi:MAG TPA: hypothetical protein VHX64_06415, partial [Caulobacteraceae bacterium]|nr:hypothetical protein [Caulobacteraceae bacterium]